MQFSWERGLLNHFNEGVIVLDSKAERSFERGVVVAVVLPFGGGERTSLMGGVSLKGTEDSLCQESEKASSSI